MSGDEPLKEENQPELWIFTFKFTSSYSHHALLCTLFAKDDTFDHLIRSFANALVLDMKFDAQVLALWQMWIVQVCPFEYVELNTLCRCWQGWLMMQRSVPQILMQETMSVEHNCALKVGALVTMVSFGRNIRCLQLTKRQRLDHENGDNLEWTTRMDSCTVYVTFGATREITTGPGAFQWLTENTDCEFATERTGWGEIKAHQGVWQCVRNDSDKLGAALKKATRTIGHATIVFCGFSKGGAEAVAAAARLLTPGLALGDLSEVPPGCSVAVVAVGAARTSSTRIARPSRSCNVPFAIVHLQESMWILMTLFLIFLVHITRPRHPRRDGWKRASDMITWGSSEFLKEI